MISVRGCSLELSETLLDSLNPDRRHNGEP